jgi:hypothetical protein
MKNRQIKINKRRALSVFYPFLSKILQNSTTNFPGNRLKLTEFIDKSTGKFLVNKTFKYKTYNLKKYKGVEEDEKFPALPFFSSDFRR